MVDQFLILLKDFANREHLSKAFRTFSLVQAHAVASGSFDSVVESICSLLLSCTNLKLFVEGKQIHSQVITWGLHDNTALIPKLVSYYTTFDLLSEAHFIVANAPILHPLSWNILISSYVSKGYYEEAISAYNQMIYKRIRPDGFTYPSILKACAELTNLEFGREIHESIKASLLNQNLFVQNALVSMYAKCGDLETARSIFDKMSIKDGISWNSIISGYASSGKWNEAFELFERMQASGVELNVITWNTIAGGYLKSGKFKETLELICHMRRSLNHLDPVTVIIGLVACSHISALKPGKEIHGLAVRNFVVDYVNVKNALITLYSRCGDLRYAYTVFQSMTATSITTWNSIICGFAQWHLSEEASFMFRELFLALDQIMLHLPASYLFVPVLQTYNMGKSSTAIL